MKPHTSLQIVSVIGAAVLVAACGGTSGPTVAGIDRTGSPSAAFAYGSISGFGSIIVNGVRYDTSTATFTIDDSPGTEAELEVGDVVLIEGTLAASRTTGTAASVTFNDNVEGPISAKPDASTLIVLGQTVRITADTSFDDSIVPASIDGLAVTDVVEVSGFVNSDGDILATRIELKNLLPGDEFEVTGIVEGHLSGAMTFMINGLVVDYSTAGSIRNFPGGDIDDGDLVEAKGIDFEIASNTLTATEVEFKGAQIAGNADDHVEIEGLITRFNDATDFDVSGYPVTTNNQTVFEPIGIASANDLALNVKVEVEGDLNSAGVLVADKVDIRRDSVVEIEGLVDSPPSAGTVTVLGITIHVDSLTRIEDKRDDVEPFGLGNIVAGDFIAVRGSEAPNAPGEVLAARLEREVGMTDDTILQGIVETVAGTSMTILGVTIDTDNVLDMDFRDETDASIGSVAFFARPPDGELVKVQGTEVADTAIDADEVEYETP
ncbi:MAG: DUF5666 domain-containing protein [Gammaproteobacteria bacterium]|nr:DUF5666 domain-containing protein [Gammaproteobacteria bacterium]MDH3505763.1 DUF5666 domain-containing protein [Gammaproteobacteria bacterium]